MHSSRSVFGLVYIISNIALILDGEKILFRSFLVRLGENLLKFYLFLISLFFWNEKINKILITVHVPPITTSN